MGQHLKRYHKIVNPAKLAEAQKKFTRLSGQRTRRPTSTQTAKPKPASKACKDPSGPKSKKQDSSDTDIISPTPKRRRQVREEEEKETSQDESSNDLDDNDRSSRSDFDVEETDNKRWKEYLDSSQRDKTVREHFVSTFYKYLLHAEGGAHSEEQAMIHTRQVHHILEIPVKDGEDLDCLIWRDSLDIWDVFAGPRLKSKELKGEMLKVYLRSLECFSKFVDKNLFFKIS